MDQQAAYTQGQTHQYEQDPSNVGSHVEDEDHDKKSVFKKVKAKAKKMKDTFKQYGYNQDQHQEGHVPDDHDLDEEKDENEEEVVNPETHGSSGYEAAAIRNAVPGQDLRDPGTLTGRSGAVDEDSSRNSQSKVADYPTESGSIPGREEGKDQLKVDVGSTGHRKEVPGTLTGRSGAVDEDSSRNSQSKVADYPTDSGSIPGREEGKDQLKVDVGRTGHRKEVPRAPANTPATLGIVQQKEINDPISSLVKEQEANRGQPENKLECLEEDPHSPKGGHVDPSNYQTKTTDPTGADGDDAGIGSIRQSFDKMNVHESKAGGEQNIPGESRGYSSAVSTGNDDQFSPELAPPKQRSPDKENPEPIQQDAYTSEVQELPREEVGQKPSNQSSYTEKISTATSAIADKAIFAKNVVASRLGYGQGQNGTPEGQDSTKAGSTMEHGKKIAPTVTEKLSPVYKKITETGSTVISKVPGISHGTGSVSERSVEGKDKGVSVKDYFAEKLRPGDEDRALSEVVSETLHKREDEGEKAGKPMGKVTESEEVKRRLGSMDENPTERIDESNEHVAGKGVVDKLKGAVGSWFGKGEETNAPSQQSLGSSTGTEGFQGSVVGEETGERRLQESRN